MSITPDLVKASLESADFGERLRAINHLRQLDPAIAFELIKVPVSDSNVRVRYAAVSQLASLGRQNLEEAATMLRAGLLDPEPDVQAAAADSIGALNLTEAFDDLQALYHRTPEWLVSFSIIAALGELGEPRGFELLEEALASDNDLLKTAAIGSLGELGDARAVGLLIPYATHPDWQIRHRLVQALSVFDSSEARSTLEKLSTDEVEQVAQQAKTCLETA